MNELFAKHVLAEIEQASVAETIERLWVRMSREQRVRALRSIAELPQRPGSTETLLECARRQAFENPTASFLPGLRYDPDHVTDYEALVEVGPHAGETFARFWLAAHRPAEWGELIWYAVGMYLYPHMQWGTSDDYKRVCLSLIRAVREARA